MKIAGIILIIISAMAFFGWLVSFSQGKSESEAPIFFVFLLILFIVGLVLVNSAKKQKEKV